MADNTQVSIIASNSIGAIPLLSSYSKSKSAKSTNEQSSSLVFVQSIVGLASTLKSILSILKNFVNSTNNRLRRQLYDEAEQKSEQDVTGKPGVAATGKGEDNSIKGILKSFLLNPFVLAGIGALMVSLIPEDIKKNFLKYTQEFLRGLDVAEWAIQGLSEAINYVKAAFVTYLGIKTAKMLTDLINKFLELKTISAAGDVVGDGGRRGKGTTKPKTGGGFRLGRGGAIGLGVAAGAAALYSVEGESILKEMKEAGTAAQNLYSEMSGATSNTTEKERQALNYFVDRGYTKDQAAGIVGNLVQESNLNPNAVGDGGQAIGIAQWHPPRQADFKKAFGKDIKDSTFEEQLAFIDWELKNTEKAANKYLQAATTPEEAASVFSKYYERPGTPMLEKRVAAANRLAANTSPAQITPGGLQGGSGDVGVRLSQTTVSNRDALKKGGSVNVAGGALPPKVVGQKENPPNIRPKIPSPVLGASELDESLFFNPTL